MKIQDEPLIFEEVYDSPADKIWNAVTDPKEMKKWYFDVPEFKPVVGCKFEFLAGEENKKYLHLCEVVEAEPKKRIAYTWRYDGYDGNSTVSFELIPESNQTRLRLTHEGLDSFPKDNPDFVKTNFIGGWTYFTEKALKEYLEK